MALFKPRWAQIACAIVLVSIVVRVAATPLALSDDDVYFDEFESTNTTHTNKSGECFTKIFPCSHTIVGNLILMLFYGALLGGAAKLIADGAEMLLDVGLPPALVGGLVLPVLGAVPDAAIIIVSGLGGDKATAQEQLQVGMGTLAGSTIMLLTIPWLGSLIIGRCDIGADGKARDGVCSGRFSVVNQGITILPDVKTSIIFMLVTMLPFFIIQGADWHCMTVPTCNNISVTAVDGVLPEQPSYVRYSALVTLIFCGIMLIAYMGFQVYDAKVAERRAKKHQQEVTTRRIAQRFYTMTSKSAFMDAAGESGREATESDSMVNRGIQKKYFNAWKVRQPTRPTVSPAAAEPQSDEEEENDKEESKALLWAKSIIMLGVGIAMVSVFSDPMVDVLSALTNSNNTSYLPIKPFYVSFVVTPICSNASELVSSLMFAAKKTKTNISMTYSQLYGAATMNNTLCLAVFMALVYTRELQWVYSAEVFVIILVQIVVGMIGFRETYQIWIGFPVAALYFVAIGLVALLESSKVGWK
ncbi:uncharacterized protein LOC135817919 isoform X2 [Sycon ciliatum]|uniref:uncharacterized protein LOC135817919 isoform X2 n=1 Tax=Sycon ciliatum TaxID=27933 RepID=UPI0031F6941B